MTNTVGKTIRAMPEDITLEPLSARRSIPGGGAKDMAIGWKDEKKVTPGHSKIYYYNLRLD